MVYETDPDNNNFLGFFHMKEKCDLQLIDILSLIDLSSRMIIRHKELSLKAKLYFTQVILYLCLSNCLFCKIYQSGELCNFSN